MPALRHGRRKSRLPAGQRRRALFPHAQGRGRARLPARGRAAAQRHVRLGNRVLRGPEPDILPRALVVLFPRGRGRHALGLVRPAAALPLAQPVVPPDAGHAGHRRVCPAYRLRRTRALLVFQDRPADIPLCHGCVPHRDLAAPLPPPVHTHVDNPRAAHRGRAHGRGGARMRPVYQRCMATRLVTDCPDLLCGALYPAYSNPPPPPAPGGGRDAFHFENP